jgi:hypothetical protein
MRWRRVAHRLPLTGVAVAGAVIGHMVAYVLAVPSPTVRVALLGATGHAYWTAAIAAAVVLGLASLAATLGRRFRAGLLAGRPQPGERLGRVAGQLASLQIAIYLIQEALERLEAGIAPMPCWTGGCWSPAWSSRPRSRWSSPPCSPWPTGPPRRWAGPCAGPPGCWSRLRP